MLNPTGGARPSYNTEMAESKQGDARFNQALITATGWVDSLIANVVMDDNLDEKAFAKSLVSHLIRRYELPTSQLLPIIATSQNPTEPNEWKWAEWENRHYIQKVGSSESSQIRYCLRTNEFQFHPIISALNSELGCSERFEICKILPFVEQKFSPGQVADCKNIHDLAKLHSYQLLPLTPLICECIQAGLFRRSFIDKLHSM